MTDIESRRYALQLELDSQKTAQERNVLRQYSTPYALTLGICQHIAKHFNGRIPSFLEPAIGTGVFYSALSEIAEIGRSVGYEIDPHYFAPTRQLWQGFGLQLVNEDFLKATPTEKFALIVANPPYSRHHHLPAELKRELNDRIKSAYGISLSGLAGLYCYFIILSTLWLEEGGISCWLVPSEFLAVNYGRQLKEFLLTKVDLLSIHTFNSEDVQFDDALVSSSILTFRNSRPSADPFTLSWGGNIGNPRAAIHVRKQQADPTAKWTEQALASGGGSTHSHYTIGSFFDIKRGIATGNNKFFIVNDEIVSHYSLPKELLTPIIPPPRSLKDDIFDHAAAERQPLYLISCAMPIADIMRRYPGYYRYIAAGVDQGVDQQSNCRHREIWYNCEKRASAPILLSYMGRNCGKSPFRFILNKTEAIATNSYLLLYPKKDYVHIFKDTEAATAVWQALCRISSDELQAHGRCYGGGLFKLEPKELSSIPCDGLASLLPPASPSLFD